MEYTYKLMEEKMGVWHINKTKIAKELGISRPALYRWIKRYQDEKAVKEGHEARKLLDLIQLALAKTQDKDIVELIEDYYDRQKTFINSLPNGDYQRPEKGSEVTIKLEDHISMIRFMQRSSVT